MEIHLQLAQIQDGNYNLNPVTTQDHAEIWRKYKLNLLFFRTDVLLLCLKIAQILPSVSVSDCKSGTLNIFEFSIVHSFFSSLIHSKLNNKHKNYKEKNMDSIK